jgi:hypothetical protein
MEDAESIYKREFCQAFVNVKFNGVLKFSGTFKIRGFDTFTISESREGGYHIR